MATWQTPKTNWAASDVIGTGDLNRIEENTEYLYDQKNGAYSGLQDFISRFKVSTAVLSLGYFEISVEGGIWFDSNSGAVDWSGASLTKTFSSSGWTAGASGECKLTGATYTVNGWFWVFAVYNPTTSTADFALDDNVNGSNISEVTALGYTQYKRICAVKTSGLVDSGSGGFIPSFFNSYDSKIRYGSEQSAMTFTKVLPLTTTTTVIVEDSGSYPLIPRDTVNALYEGVEIEFMATGSTASIVTFWDPSEFGTSYVTGIGETVVISGSDFTRIRVTTSDGEIMARATPAVALTGYIRNIKYNTSGGTYP